MKRTLRLHLSLIAGISTKKSCNDSFSCSMAQNMLAPSALSGGGGTKAQTQYRAPESRKLNKRKTPPVPTSHGRISSSTLNITRPKAHKMAIPCASARRLRSLRSDYLESPMYVRPASSPGPSPWEKSISNEEFRRHFSLLTLFKFHLWR